MEDRWYSPPSRKVLMYRNDGCYIGTARWPRMSAKGKSQTKLDDGFRLSPFFLYGKIARCVMNAQIQKGNGWGTVGTVPHPKRFLCIGGCYIGTARWPGMSSKGKSQTKLDDGYYFKTALSLCTEKTHFSIILKNPQETR